MALSKTTQDHEEIRRWAEARQAKPAEVASTQKGGEPGILRFAFPKASNRKDENLKEISWEDFFEKFDSNNLELVYQEKTAAGKRSNFNKLIHPEHERSSGQGSTSTGKKGLGKKETHKRRTAA
jgi:hypothetical protein